MSFKIINLFVIFSIKKQDEKKLVERCEQWEKRACENYLCTGVEITGLKSQGYIVGMDRDRRRASETCAAAGRMPEYTSGPKITVHARLGWNLKR